MRYVFSVAAVALFIFSAQPSIGADAPKKEEPLYGLSFDAPKAAKTGAAAACLLTITPKSGWTLKTNTPFKMEISSNAAVELPQIKFTAKDFVDAKEPNKRINTGFKATKAGKHDIDAKLTFFVCSDTICKRQKDAAKCSVETKVEPK